MPSTDKARINSKASMVQSVSQTTVCSNGLSGIHSEIGKGKYLLINFL